MAHGPSALQIFVLHGGQLLASEVFGEGEYSIGRDTTADLILPHEDVSAHHATLKVQGERALLVDEESDLGTIVNGRAVRTVELKSADEIYMGPFLLKVRSLNHRNVAPLPPASRVRRPTPLMPTPLPGGLAGAARIAPSLRARPIPIEAVAAKPVATKTVESIAAKPVAPRPAPLLNMVTSAELAEKTLVSPPPPPDDDELDDLPEVTAEPISAPPRVVAEKLVATARPMTVQAPKAPPPRLIPAPPPPKDRQPKRKAVGKERLFVRILWGEQLVSVQSFGTSDEVVAAPDDDAPIPLHGFRLVGPVTLARASKGSWTIHPPAGVTVAFKTPEGGWRPPPTSHARSYLLPARVAVRLTVGNVHVEFASEAAAARPRWRVGRIDPVFAAILLPLLIAGIVVVRRMPHIPKEERAPEVQRFAKYIESMQTRAKPPLPPPEKPKLVEKAPAPKPIAQAETLKAANAPLKTVEKVVRATREIDTLLDALHRVDVSPHGGTKNALAGINALPSLPSLGNLSAPNRGLGDLGSPGGPLTRGLGSIGSAGSLGGATAGSGDVRGIPIKVPKKPSHVQGDIDRDALARVINAHVDEMRGCYERALLKDPNIGGGKVTLEWTIGPSGDVMDIGTKTSSLRSSEVVTCLLGVVRALHFPKPEGGVVIVSYPILFNSVGY